MSLQDFDVTGGVAHSFRIIFALPYPDGHPEVLRGEFLPRVCGLGGLFRGAAAVGRGVIAVCGVSGIGGLEIEAGGAGTTLGLRLA